MAYGCAASLAILASLSIPCLKVLQLFDFEADLGLDYVLPVLESVASSTSSSSPSWLWSSTSTSPPPSDNVVSERSSFCDEQCYVSVYYYSYYGAYSCGDRSVCGCNASPTTLSMLLQKVSSMLFLMLIWCMSFSLALLACQINVRGAGIALCQQLRLVAAGASADLKDVLLAVAFCCSQVLFILARRLPCARRRLRSLALAIRPYVVASVVTGEPMCVFSPHAASPRGVMSPPASSARRRPLAQIQMDYRVEHGGKCTYRRKLICRARLARSVRLSSIRTSCWRTTFNPVAASGKGNCLFAVLAKVLPGELSADGMRKRIRAQAAKLLVSGDKVLCGRSLAEILTEHSIDATQFMSQLVRKSSKHGKKTRWGNSIDVLIAAHLFQMQLRVYDIRQHRYICDANLPGPCATIGYLEHHFVAGKVKPVQHHDDLSPLSLISSLCLRRRMILGLGALCLLSAPLFDLLGLPFNGLSALWYSLSLPSYGQYVTGCGASIRRRSPAP
eukprot:5375323-Amphidinium_carterae.1